MNSIRRTALHFVALLGLVFLTCCGQAEKPYSGTPLPYQPDTAPKAKEPNPVVQISTSLGDIEVELWEDDAPNTVGNFVSLVDSGFYNGLTFHRIIKDFMIQGGDPKGNGSGGPGYKFPDEVRDREKSEHPNKTDKYVLAMANSGPSTNGSQFFIMTGTSTPNPGLDVKHTVFGKVTKGTDVVDKLAALPTDGDRPKDPPKMTAVKVLSKRKHPYVVRYQQPDAPEKNNGLPPGLSFGGQPNGPRPQQRKLDLKRGVMPTIPPAPSTPAVKVITPTTPVVPTTPATPVTPATPETKTDAVKK